MAKPFRFLLVLAVLCARAAQAQQWQLMDGKALDVGVGADGTAWVIGAGHDIYRRNSNGWTNIPGGADRIAVDPSGNAWVVNAGHQIYHYNGSHFVLVPGAANDIGVGANGTVWIIGTHAMGGGYGIFRSTNNGATWTAVPGAAVRVSVDPSGNAWVVTDGGAIFRFNGASFVQLPGAATDIGVGPDGAAWVIGSDHSTIYRWDGSNWAKKSGGATQIAAGPGGAVWVVNGANEIYKGQDTPQSSAVVVGPVTGVVVGPVTGTPITAGSSPVVTPSAPLVVTGLAPAATAAIPGSLVCPIIVAGPRLQTGCALLGAPAVFIAKAPSADCTGGSFYDPRNNGECWTCPAGFMRYTTPVNGPDACWKAIGENLASATKTAKFGCQVGYFGDPRNGGECWQCPSGYYRTLDAVTWGTACAKAILGPFSSATQGAKPVTSCGSGFTDPIDGGTCWTCPAGYRRTLYAVTASNACAQTVETQYVSATQKAGCSMLPSRIGYGTPFRDPRNGGECWACPIPLQRSASPVDATGQGGILAACSAGGNTNLLVWKLPQYPEPGAYRFTDGLLAKALGNPQLVDAFLSRQAGGDPSRKRALWTAMIADPAGSAELKALLLAALVSTATESSPDPAAVASLQRFEQYAHDRRVFIAAEATRMYNAWQGVDGYNTYEAARTSSGLGGLSSAVIGDAGGDYRSYAWSAAVPDSDGVAAVVATASLAKLEASPVGTTLNSGVGRFTLEYFLPLTESLSHSLDAIMEAGGDMITDASTLSELGQGALVLKGAGVAFVGLQLAAAGIEIAKGVTALIEKDKAATEYAEFAAKAAEPFSVRELAESTNPDDKQTLLLFWALATSPYAASDKLGTGRISTAALCSSDSWTSAECVRAKAIVASAAKAAGY